MMSICHTTTGNPPPNPITRILIATDTYAEQHNGVAHSLRNLAQHLSRQGIAVEVLQTDTSKALSLPNREEIKFELPDRTKIRKFIQRFNPDSIHIATEGPIGFHVRAICLQHGYQFSTSFHTLWPAYAREHVGIPEWATWKLLRWFHGPASTTMTRSKTMVEKLQEQGFRNVVEWNGSVNLDKFERTDPDPFVCSLPRPILLYIGRVSSEKNLDAFLEIPIKEGSKVVVGDGSYLPELRAKYPGVHFLGAKSQHELPKFYSAGDVFVFPSETDTFGCVVVEALACGVPVAALPVAGPKDIITSAELGCLDYNLEKAIKGALANGKAGSCREGAKRFSLEATARQFLRNLTPAKQLVERSGGLLKGLWEKSFMGIFFEKAQKS